MHWILLMLLLKFDSINGLDFLLEDGSLTFASNIKIKDFDLDLPVKITSNDITNFQTAINKTYTDFMAAAFIRGTAGLTAHAGNVFQMNDGLNKCNHAVETARALLKSLNNNTTKPESHSCMKICKPIDVTDLSAIQGRLELSGAKVTNTWTTVDVDTDKGKRATIDIFAHQFSYEMEAIHAKLTSILNTFDVLTSFEYPQDLYGIYHDVPCLGVITNEDIHVKKCNAHSEGMVCNIEIWHPERLQTVPTLTPIEYEVMSIVLPNGEDVFVKTEIGSHYQVLDCHNGPGKMTTHTVCQVNRLQTDCELALTNRNTADVVKYCSFAKTKTRPSSIRLADKSIVIMDRLATVSLVGTPDGTIIKEPVPYQLYSPTNVKVTSNGLTLEYPGIKNLPVQKITNSSIPKYMIASLVNKLTYDGYWDELMSLSFVDLALLTIQLLVLVGLICGLKAYDRMHNKKLNYWIRKQQNRLIPLRARNRTTNPMQETRQL